MNLFLGVDGGGTSTLSYLSDSLGNIRASEKSGFSNYQVVGADNALKAIKESISKAVKKAEIKEGDLAIEVACFGLAGIDTKKD